MQIRSVGIDLARHLSPVALSACWRCVAEKFTQSSSLPSQPTYRSLCRDGGMFGGSTSLGARCKSKARCQADPQLSS